jgi:hypothetical protein
VYPNVPEPESKSPKEGKPCAKTGGKKSKGVDKRPTPTMPPMTLVVDFCPNCGDPVYGEPQVQCKKRKREPVFYKECKTCQWWAEIWRYGNKYKEVEGG